MGAVDLLFKLIAPPGLLWFGNGSQGRVLSLPRDTCLEPELYLGMPDTDKKFAPYKGTRDAVEINYGYLMLDKIKTKLPERFTQAHEKWRKGFEGLEFTETEFKGDVFTHLYHKFIGHIRYYERMPKKYCYNPNGSAGFYFKTWYKERYSGKGVKRDFYDLPESQYWLRIFEQNCWQYNWIEPYTACPKDEMTDITDIQAGKCRVFYAAGVYTDYVCEKWNYSINKAFTNMPFTTIGKRWEYGEIPRFGASLNSFLSTDESYVLEESDCSKYDLCQDEWWFDLLRDLRVLLISEFDQEAPEKFAWLYRCARLKYLVWFDGSMLICDRANPSGWRCTCEDNTFRHYIARVFHYGRMGLSLEEIDTNVYMNLMSDDSLNISDKRFVGEDDLAESYARLGMVYKGYVTPPSRHLKGKTYCGINFLNDSGGRFTISKDKCFFSANFRKGLSNIEYKNKLDSLSYLLGADEESLRRFSEYVRPVHRVNLAMAKLIATGRVQ